MKERYKYNIVSFFSISFVTIRSSFTCFGKISYNSWKLGFINDYSGKWIIFLTNKSWIVFEYLINNQNGNEKILKIRNFVLFIYLL